MVWLLGKFDLTCGGSRLVAWRNALRRTYGLAIALACSISLVGPAVATAQDSPYMISAFFGLDDSVDGQFANLITSPLLNPWNTGDNQNRANPTGANLDGTDGLPVVFSELLDPTSLDPSDFLITTASGATYTPLAATVNPAHDEDERRTVALFGEFGDAPTASAPGDPPVLLSVVGQLLTIDGLDVSQSAPPVDVIPLADGPTLVYAETVDPASVDFVANSELVLRAVWAGGVVATDGNEVTEQEWSQYVLSGIDVDGNPVELTPMAIGDLNDFDNNHLLYFDQAITPNTLWLPEGLVIDPNGDVNLNTSVTVIPEPGTLLLLGLGGLIALQRRSARL